MKHLNNRSMEWEFDKVYRKNSLTNFVKDLK